MYENYTLDVLTSYADVMIFRLTPPSGGEMESTRIAFLPGGYTVIYGDLCPGGGNGIISNDRYGIAWFYYEGREMSDHYLASKFRVEQTFSPERAAAHFSGLAAEADDRKLVVLYTGLAEMAKRVDSNDPAEVERFVSDISEATGDSTEHTEGCYEPDPRVMRVLTAAQAAFARLWHKHPDHVPA